MLEVKEIIHKLKCKLKELFDKKETKHKKASYLEDRTLPNDNKSAVKSLPAGQPKEQRPTMKDCVGHSVLSGNGNCLSYGTFDEMECPDASKCGHVATTVQRELRAAQDAKLHSQLMLPKELIGRLTHDIIAMAQCEPCGVRGCVMYLNVERKGTNVPLNVLTFEPDSVATFELNLTLIEEKTAWSGFLRILRTFLMPCSAPRYRSKIFISPNYRIVKKKLYKSS